MASDEDHVRVSDESESESKSKAKKPKEPGIIYLSRIPMMMNVTTIRSIFSQYGEVGKIFLQPDTKGHKRGKKVRCFSEGWVEFEDKRKAKRVAANLNNQQIGGKRKSPWFEEIWNIKYLPKFKWAHLNERLAYEKAVHEQRMRTEISQVKREADFHKQNFEKSRMLKDIEQRKRKQGEEFEEQNFKFKLRDTEDEILAKKQKLGSGKKPLRLSSKAAGSSKSFLSSLFSGGGKMKDDEGE
ncbi:activator of basal transcription 1-like [Haliotis asinina]|uniref:activator of basal transcription 1-like n=1 Tax=Haliotis asinina TaxID=109174 RepID=UPI003532583F